MENYNFKKLVLSERKITDFKIDIDKNLLLVMCVDTSSRYYLHIEKLPF